MKSRVQLEIILVLVACGSSVASESRLVGCPNPDAIATAMSKLEQTDWHELTSTQVRAIWPENLNSVPCERDKGCRMLGSNGRIIENHCECCEVFDFDLKHDADDTDELRNIIIHYSARDRQEVVGVAKKIARAVGLPDSKLATVGKNRIQKYEWQNSKGRATETDLELQFTRLGAVWEVYLALAHE